MKIKTLKVSPELLMDFLKNPVPPGITQEGLPADAKIVWAGWEPGTIIFHLESNEFDSGGELTPVFKQNAPAQLDIDR
jgi:hypothetical protein